MLKEGKVSRVVVERFQTGDDILSRLNDLVRVNAITAGTFIALGAVQKACIGFLKGDGEYSQVEMNGPLEILSCMGNISLKDGSPFIHAHIALSDENGRAFGGHLMPGCIVGATFEVTLHDYTGMNLRRERDRNSKLYLLDT